MAFLLSGNPIHVYDANKVNFHKLAIKKLAKATEVKALDGNTYKFPSGTIAAYSDEEINAYLDTDEPYDKAGAYAIQGIFSKYIDHYEGSFNNVVGFPWELIEKEIAAI